MSVQYIYHFCSTDNESPNPADDNQSQNNDNVHDTFPAMSDGNNWPVAHILSSFNGIGDVFKTTKKSYYLSKK